MQSSLHFPIHEPFIPRREIISISSAAAITTMLSLATAIVALIELAAA